MEERRPRSALEGAPRRATLPGPLTTAVAGTAFAVGVVATLELLTLALPGPRAAFRTWGPALTVLAGGALVVIGLPGALLVETATRSARRRALASAAGYLVIAALAGVALWLGWRALVAADAGALHLAREFLVLGAGAGAIWGGARLAERHSPALIIGFCAAALLALTAATALVHL